MEGARPRVVASQHENHTTFGTYLFRGRAMAAGTHIRRGATFGTTPRGATRPAFRASGAACQAVFFKRFLKRSILPNQYDGALKSQWERGFKRF